LSLKIELKSAAAYLKQKKKTQYYA